MDCPFDVLHLPKSASLEEIDKQWKKLVRIVHPDKIGAEAGTEKTKILNDARERVKLMYNEIDCVWARRMKVLKAESEARKKTGEVRAQQATNDNEHTVQDLQSQLRLAKKHHTEMVEKMESESIRANDAEKKVEELKCKAVEINALLATESARANKAEQKVSENEKEASICIENAEKEAVALRLENAKLAAEVQVLEAKLKEADAVQPEAEEEGDCCAPAHKKQKRSGCGVLRRSGLKAEVKRFVVDCIVSADKDSIVSTQQLMDEFKKRGYGSVSFKQFVGLIWRSIQDVHPSAGTYKKSFQRGYTNIALK